MRIPNLEQLSAIERRRRAAEFVEAARFLMLAKGSEMVALDHAAAERAPAGVVSYFKAAISGMLDSDLGAEQMAGAFLATVTNSAFDNVLADAIRIPLHSRYSIITGNASAAEVARGQAKPVGQLVAAGATLTERKAVALIVLSNEILAFATNANAAIAQSLRASVAAAVDSIFIPALISATSPITASGTTAADALYDIQRMLDVLSIDASSRLHLILGADVAARLSVLASTTGARAFPEMTPSGGTLGGIRVSVSDALTDSAVLVDARAIVADSAAIRLRSSTAASIEMDTAPSNTPATGSPLAPAELTMVSAWQTNSTVLLAERFFGFSIARASGVASLATIQWGLVGSPLA